MEELFVAGTLRRLLESAVLSAIELKLFFGKYRFVYIFFLLIKLFPCCISFNFMQSNIQARVVNH